MKQSFNFLLFILCSVLFIQCSDESHHPQGRTLVEVTISLNDSFHYNLGSFGDEEGASITQQPVSFQASYLERKNDVITYQFVPEENFVGKVLVKLKSARGSDGASENNDVSNTIIEITVTQ